jgi:hypothetical protein
MAKEKDPLVDEAYEAFRAEEQKYQDGLDKLARESGFFVDCDEEIFPLNDDGSAKKDKGEKSDDLKIF